MNQKDMSDRDIQTKHYRYSILYVLYGVTNLNIDGKKKKHVMILLLSLYFVL